MLAFSKWKQKLFALNLPLQCNRQRKLHDLSTYDDKVSIMKMEKISRKYEPFRKSDSTAL